MKRKLALIVVSILLLSSTLLIGCDKKSKTSTAAMAPNKEAVDYSGLDADAMIVANDAHDWKITEDKVTIRVMVINQAEHPADFNEIPLFSKMEERTNVHVDWVMPGASSFNEQRALALATGDMPDVILHGITESEIAKYGPEGVLASYDDLMEKYPGAAPSIEKMYRDHPESKVYSTAPDGKVYAMPRVNEGPWMLQDGNQIINQEWLATLSLPMPTTTAEFKDTLIAFRDGDPNGNGQADEIPLMFNGTNLQGWQGINYIMGSFGVVSGNDFRMLKDGAVVNSATQDGWKEGIKFYHDLYLEGLIDADSFSMEGAQYTAKLALLPTVVGCAEVWDINDQVPIPNATTVFTYLPPLKHNDITPVIYSFYAPGWDRSGSVISAKTEYPEVALRWVDYLYDTINSLEMIEGDFNGRLERVDEGYFIIGDPPEGLSQGESRYKASPGHSGAWAIFKQEYADVLRLPFTEPKSNFNAENCAPYYDAENTFPPVFFNEGEADEMSTLNTDIINEITRQASEWIMNGQVDETWDAYIEKLNAIGLERWLEINETAYGRYGK